MRIQISLMGPQKINHPGTFCDKTYQTRADTRSFNNATTEKLIRFLISLALKLRDDFIVFNAYKVSFSNKIKPARHKPGKPTCNKGCK